MILLSELRHTLQLLASPPETALAWLRRESKRVAGGVELGIDEIALDFDNWAQASWQLVETGMLSKNAHESVLALSAAIEAIGSDAVDWTPAAFTESPKWLHVRAEAAAILNQLEADR